jgi:hypothetical protein
MYVFRIPERDHEIIIFGDMHFSYTGMCKPCNPRECETITLFIERYAKTKKSLDVFLELPYVTRNKVIKKMWVNQIDTVTQRNVDNLQYIDHGEGERVIGIIGHLFRVFKKNLYDDETKMTGNVRNVRFHYADARHEHNVVRMIPSDVDRLIKQTDGDIGRIVTTMRAMIFGIDFASSLSSLTVRERQITFPFSLSTWRGRPVHKVAKQFLKLPAGEMKNKLKSYLEGRLEDVERTIRNIKQTKARATQIPLNDEMLIYIRTIIMDAYLLSRMMYYANLDRTVGGASIVYVGHSHSIEIVKFLRDSIGLQLISCDPGSNIDTHHPRRCMLPKSPCTPHK